MGGFLTGLLNTVGPKLQEKNADFHKQQAAEKSRQIDTQWTAMQTAVTTLDKLKRKQDAGQELSPEEVQQAQQAAGVWQQSQQEYSKLTKANKPLNEAFQKVGGFVQKILTSKRNQLSPPQAGQQQPQPGGGAPSAQAPMKMDKSPIPTENGTLGTGSTPKLDQQAGAPSPNGKLTGPPSPAPPAPAQQSTPLQAPPPSPKPPQSSIPQLDPKQRAMLYGSPGYAKQQEGEAEDQRKLQLKQAEEESADKRKLQFEQAEQEAWVKRGKDLGIEGRDLAEYAGSKGARLPAQSKPVKDIGIERPGYDGAWNHTVEPDGSETWSKQAAKATSSGVPRVIGHISATDAKTQAGKGKKFQDEAGNDLDVSELPEQMALTTVTQGNKVFYVPMTQAQTHFNVGGKVYAVPTLEQINLAQGAGVELGASRTPTDTTHSQVAFDASGNPVVNTLPGKSVPSTPGIPGRQSAGAPGASSGTASPRPQGQGAAAPQQSTGGATLRGVPAGMFNQNRQIATPVREAAAQLFGDPSQPTLKGLNDFADLADNKESRERLGKALRLTFAAMDQATDGAHIAAGAGPISISTGGVGTWLQNYFHVPQNIAAQQAGMMQDAIKDLTPEEQRAYDATMSAFGTIVGLRSLTRASAAQASVATIEREMPVLGVNSTSKAQFNDQMARLAEIVYNGTKGLPPGTLSPDLVDRIKGQVKKSSAPSPNGKLSGPAKPISSKAEYDALPKGAQYIDSDGKPYIKK